jgi:hypothetical protein
MITREVTYIDYNGVEQTEKYYFDLTVPEMLELSFSSAGDIQSTLERLSNSRKVGEIFSIIQTLIFKSVGVKSDDGKRFVKNEEVLNDFKQSRGYESFLMKMMQDTDYASKFIEQLIPQDRIQQIAGVEKVDGKKHPLAMDKK